MGPDRPFLGLPVPHDCPTLPQDLSGVTDELVRLLRSLQPKGPYFIGGWSLKYGMVAYDLAQRLVREGDEVGLLVLFDVFNPARAAGSAAGLSPLSRVPGLSRRRTSRSASTRPLADRFRQAAARVQRLTWLARYELHSRLGVGDRPSAGREESPLYWATRGYRPEPYPGRTILFRAEADLARYPQDSLLGWEKLIPNIELEIVPGDRATMLTNRMPIIWPLSFNAGSRGGRQRPAFTQVGITRARQDTGEDAQSPPGVGMQRWHASGPAQSLSAPSFTDPAWMNTRGGLWLVRATRIADWTGDGRVPIWL